MTAKTEEAPPVETTPPGASDAGKPAEPTSTEKLFPDFYVEGEDGKKELTTERQDSPEPEKPAAEAPKPPVTPEPPKTPEPKAPEYLDLSQISGKLVKTKVDGVETDVPAEELLKNFQLDRHLTQRSQSLAEQEKALKELHGELTKIKDEVKTTVKGEDGETPDPRLETVLKKIDAIEQRISKPQLTKADVDNNLARIAGEVQRNLGYDDFMEMIPQITAEISKNFANPKAPTEQELARFDTMANWYQTYQAVKLRSLKNAPPPPPAPAPPAKNAPVLDKKPPIPPSAIEEAGGASDGNQEESSQWKVRYDLALKQAKESGTDEAWQDVFRLKREKSDS